MLPCFVPRIEDAVLTFKAGLWQLTQGVSLILNHRRHLLDPPTKLFVFATDEEAITILPTMFEPRD